MIRKTKKNGLTRERLESLTTPRLIAYLQALLKVCEDADWEGECPDRWHKQHPAWKAHHAMVKEILDTRENI